MTRSFFKVVLFSLAFVWANMGHVSLANIAVGEFEPIVLTPEQEERAKAIEQVLRCVVCQSQSIAESDAPLANDMSYVVREQIAAGATDQEVIDYLVARYGDYILLKPKFKTQTAFLWLFPFASIIIGGVLTVMFLRSRPQEIDQTLTEAEENELAGLGVEVMSDQGKKENEAAK